MENEEIEPRDEDSNVDQLDIADATQGATENVDADKA